MTGLHRLWERPQATSLRIASKMKASVDFRAGNSVALHATARTTPAGLIAAGLMVSAIVLAAATLVWAVRGRAT
jgi:hypothetical protein